MSIVINEPQFTKLVHKVAHARPGRADHLGERFLTDLCENWLVTERRFRAPARTFREVL